MMKIYNNIIKKLHEFLLGEEGVALIEFAIAVPVLLTLFLGGTEIARALIIEQRLQNTATSLGDAASEIDVRNLTKPADFMSYMDFIYQASIGMMGSYGSTTTIILTDISNPTGAGAQANWHCVTNGTPIGAAITKLTLAGSTVLINGTPIAVNQGDELIVSEGFYNFSPIIANIFLSPFQFYTTATYPLRFSATLGNTYVTGLTSGTYARCSTGL